MPPGESSGAVEVDSVGPEVALALPARLWRAVSGAVGRFVTSLSLTGLALGILAFAASTTPSLVPRGPLYQGVLSGLSLALGYGAGAGARRVLHAVGLHRTPPARLRPRLRLGLLVLLGVVIVVTLLTGVIGQRELAELWGLEKSPHVSLLPTALLALGIALALVGLWRGLRRVVSAVARLLAHWIPRPVAGVTGLVVVLVVVATVVNGAFHTLILGSFTASFESGDTETADGVEQPTQPERSGSPTSLEAWDTLGFQGRSFAAGGPSVAEIEAVTGSPAIEPIRVYAGIASNRDEDGEADLDALAAGVVDELDRTGAWDREVVVVATTTGTGWVDPLAAATLEYLTGGDSAIAAMQYSVNPSWVTLVLDLEKPQRAGRALFDAVQARWAELPEDDRPLLLAFGLSLGSYGSQAAFPTLGALTARADGALWVGTPPFTELWRDLTDQRDAGTPEIHPVLDGGEVVRWATSNGGDQGLTELGPSGWPRVVYLQHPSDGVVWWWTHTFWREDDWFREPNGQDVLPGIRWWPGITGLALMGDMFVAGGSDIPLDYGHNYAEGYVDSWYWLVEPDGWDADSLAALREVIVATPRG